MKYKTLIQAMLIALVWSLPYRAAIAYTLSGTGCNGDGTECKVYCNNGTLAGSMFWNGSVWTDGVKSDSDKDAMAKKVCAANGAACT